MKKGFIQIYDNILPRELSNSIENLILKDQVVNLVYTPNITNPQSDNFYPGFGNNFLILKIINLSLIHMLFLK